MSHNLIVKITMEFMNPRVSDINKLQSIIRNSKTLMTHQLNMESYYAPIQYTTVIPQTLSLLNTLTSDNKVTTAKKLIL